MRKLSFILALTLLFSVGGVIAERDAGSLGVTLTEVYSINPKHNPNWLEDRDLLLINAYRDGYQLITPAGETLFSVNWGKVTYEKFGYFTVINESGLNKCGLMNEKGDIVIPFAYSDFTVLTPRYAIAVALEPTDDDAYDYGSGFFGSGADHYNVTSYDFYDVEAAQKIGSLTRTDYKRSVRVTDNGFLIKARNGDTRWYDLSLQYVKDSDVDFDRAESYTNTETGIVRTALNPGTPLEGIRFYNDTRTDAIAVKSRVDDRYGAIDNDGNTLVPCEFTEILRREDEYVIVGLYGYSDRKYGVYKIGEGLTVPCEYDKFERVASSTYIANGYLMFNDQDKVGYVDLSGEITMPAKYKKAIVTVLGSAFFATDLEGNYILVAADGTQSTLDYEELNEYDNKSYGRLIAARNHDGKWGFIDCYGEPVTAFDNDSKYFGSFSSSGDYVKIGYTLYKVE